MKESKIKYLVRLRWIRPIKREIYYETKLAEFIPFIASHEIDRERKLGKPSVKSRIFLPEFIHLALFWGFRKDGKKGSALLHSEDGEAYLRLLVYAVVRQTIRSEVKASLLKEILKRLPYIEVRYWAVIFSRYFREYENIRALYKPARAFKEVYDIDG